uniref:Uncharacterized protein n=1 Tax=Anopheles funestus TaxID=62324 RepID=A0A182S007_ANOFN
MSLNSRNEELEQQLSMEDNLVAPSGDSVATNVCSSTADIPGTMASTNIVSSSDHLQSQLVKMIGCYLESFTVLCYFFLGTLSFTEGASQVVGFMGPSFSMWVYCALTSIRQLNIPKPDEHYTYIYQTYGPLLAFCYLWSATVIFVPSINAMLGLTFASCVSQLLFAVGWSVPPIGLKLLAVVTICALTYITAYDVRVTTKMQNVFMFTKIGSLVLAIVVGMFCMTVAGDSKKHFENALNGTETNVEEISNRICFDMCSYVLMKILNYMFDAVRVKHRLAFQIQTFLPFVAVGYLISNLGNLNFLRPQHILSTDAIAMTFAQRTMSYGWLFMPIVVSIPMCIALHMHIMASSGMFFVGSPNGHMREILSNINVTPKSQLWFLCVLSILYVSFCDMYVLNINIILVEVVYTMLSTLMFRNALVNLQCPLPMATLVCICGLIFLSQSYLMVSNIVLTVIGIPLYYIAKCRQRNCNRKRTMIATEEPKTD